MLAVHNREIAWSRSAVPFMTSIAANNLLPSRTGDALRAVAFSGCLGVPAARVLATVLAERLMDLLSGSIPRNILTMAQRDIVHTCHMAAFLGLTLLSATFRDRRVALLMASVYLGCAVMVAAPGRNFPHDYQLLLPVMAVGYGAHMAAIVPARKRVVDALLTLAPIWIGFGYFTSPNDWPS